MKDNWMQAKIGKEDGYLVQFGIGMYYWARLRSFKYFLGVVNCITNAIIIITARKQTDRIRNREIKMYLLLPPGGCKQPAKEL